jgi:hypothetical protein
LCSSQIHRSLTGGHKIIKLGDKVRVYEFGYRLLYAPFSLKVQTVHGSLYFPIKKARAIKDWKWSFYPFSSFHDVICQGTWSWVAEFCKLSWDNLHSEKKRGRKKNALFRNLETKPCAIGHEEFN